MRIIAILSSLLLFAACHHASSNENKTADTIADVSPISRGMKMNEVLQHIGQPTVQNDLGYTQNADSTQTHIYEWYYGDNQVIRFAADTVTSVIHDVKKADEQIQHIIDSARMAGDTAALISPAH